MLFDGEIEAYCYSFWDRLSQYGLFHVLGRPIEKQLLFPLLINHVHGVQLGSAQKRDIGWSSHGLSAQRARKLSLCDRLRNTSLLERSWTLSFARVVPGERQRTGLGSIVSLGDFYAQVGSGEETWGVIGRNSPPDLDPND